MKEEWKELKRITPNLVAKQNVLEKWEEQDKMNAKHKRVFLKGICASLLLVGCLTAFLMNGYSEDSISVQAQEVEEINQKIEWANQKYVDGKISYERYQREVKPLVEKREGLVETIQAKDSKFTFEVVETLDENGEKVVDITISDKK